MDYRNQTNQPGKFVSYLQINIFFSSIHRHIKNKFKIFSRFKAHFIAKNISIYL